MKIAYISPGILPKAELECRQMILSSWAGKDVEIKVHAVSSGPRSIESVYEEHLSVIPTCQKIVEIQEKGIDAVILGCACDPGLAAMREIAQNMLIVGAGSSSYMMASMLGYRFAVLTIDRSMVQSCYHLARSAGCAEKLVAVEPVEIPVLSLSEDYNKTLKKLCSIGDRLIREERVDTLVLGCMSMGFLGVAEEITERLGIPCINPCKAALKMAEALVGADLMHSKMAYPLPPKLRKENRWTINDLLIYRE